MKPGGAFEMLEEDLYWPGKRRDADADSESDPEPASSPAPAPSPIPHSNDSARSESPVTPRATVRTESARETQASPMSPSDTKNDNRDKDNTLSPSPTPVFYMDTTTAKDTKKNETIPSLVGATRWDASSKSLFSLPPMTKSMSSQSATTRPPALSISTMPSSPSKAAVNEAVAEGKINNDNPRASTSTASEFASTRSQRRTSFSPSTPTTSVSMSPQFTQFSPVKPSFSYPHLVRTAPLAPANPRDHTVLETIYTEMHANRFINLAPLSLLPNNLSTWFRGARFSKRSRGLILMSHSVRC